MKYAASVLVFAFGTSLHAAEPEWVEPMKKVHAQFTGTPGTLALFGDSITVSLGFWTPLDYAPKTIGEDIAKPLGVVRTHMKNDCWRKWRGAEYGNDGGQTIRWADKHVDEWLKKLNPEAVVLMFGTNDLNPLDEKEFDEKTRTVIERCLKNGAVVMLTTIPPRSGLLEKSKKFAEVQRKIAADMKLPLIDYQAEILKRRPEDWDGSQPKFAEFAKDVYQAPTLISGDGVHPSNPRKFQDYSAESLNANGFLLRNVLTVKTYADVIGRVLTIGK